MIDILGFDAVCHAAPPSAARHPPVVVDSRELTPLAVELPLPSLPVTFDELVATLEPWPRMFCEWDGSFVWSGEVESVGRWQLDGLLVDGGPALAHLELRGSCPVPAFDHLLATLHWPSQRLIFQLPRHGVYLAEPDFRRWAAESG